MVNNGGLPQRFWYATLKENTCGDAAGGLTTNCIIIIIMLLTKFLSAYNRIDPSRDSGFEKCKGLITSVLPMITIGSSLVTYYNQCYKQMEDMPEISNLKLGPGYAAFCFAVATNAAGFVIHLITPVPDDRRSCIGESNDLDTASEMSQRGPKDPENPPV